MAKSEAEKLTVSDENVYTGLRDEITKRLDIRYQLVNYTLAAFAALMTLGISQDGSVFALLIYPLIATGLALTWIDNHYRSKLIASYLRQRGSHWENALENYRKDHSSLLSREWLGSWSIGAIFLGTQIIALVSGLYIMGKSTLSDPNAALGLAILSGLTFAYTALMLFKHKDIEIDMDNDKRESQKTASSASGGK